jgi:hypothetical protein
MKQKDYALILIIIFISAIGSYFASQTIFKTPKNLQQAEVVQPISADFPSPDKHYFNKQAFDPTQVITIGNNDNSNPFNDTSSQ